MNQYRIPEGLCKINVISHLYFNEKMNDKYNNLFNNPQYQNNMCLSDLFSAISNNKIKGNFYHSSKYWLDNDKRISEITANIETIYLNKDTKALKIISSIKSLDDIKNKVVQQYNGFTK